MATYFINARGESGSLGIFAESAADAAVKCRELHAAGLRVRVLDDCGCEHDPSQLEGTLDLDARSPTLIDTFAIPRTKAGAVPPNVFLCMAPYGLPNPAGNVVDGPSLNLPFPAAPEPEPIEVPLPVAGSPDHVTPSPTPS